MCKIILSRNAISKKIINGAVLSELNTNLKKTDVIVKFFFRFVKTMEKSAKIFEKIDCLMKANFFFL